MLGVCGSGSAAIAVNTSKPQPLLRRFTEHRGADGAGGIAEYGGSRMVAGGDQVAIDATDRMLALIKSAAARQLEQQLGGVGRAFADHLGAIAVQVEFVLGGNSTCDCQGLKLAQVVQCQNLQLVEGCNRFAESELGVGVIGDRFGGDDRNLRAYI